MYVSKKVLGGPRCSGCRPSSKYNFKKRFLKKTLFRKVIRVLCGFMMQRGYSP